jgi:ketosteroid isomerase-like protein
MVTTKYFAFILAGILLLSACNNTGKTDTTGIMEKARTEIAKAEKDFETMAAEKGIAEAFWFYADSNAVIKRQHDTLVHGRDNIRNYYSAETFRNASVKWSPDFIDVSGDGNMAYTYGRYLWQSKDSLGNTSELSGVFHTVWKKQQDGTWKYVWD